MVAQHLDEIVSLCKRRGFLFSSAELYGGLQGVYDYGPLGIELKNALKATWWATYVHKRDDIVGLDSAILSHPLLFRYSGHEVAFSDLLIDCLECQHRFRQDQLTTPYCEHCGSTRFTEPRPFNLMLQTQLGPLPGRGNSVYLRPETAQGVFSNFKNVLNSTSQSLPFGIAQIGKAFRNEITPRHFIFRVREFEQMEIEFFVKPGEDEKWHQQWVNWRYAWWQAQGLSPERLRQATQAPEDLAQYAKATVDIQYQFPHGFEELEGIANRTDYDLGSHSKGQYELAITAAVGTNIHSTHKLAILDKSTQQWIVPYVIEPSAGLDRGILAILTEAYHEEPLPQNQSRIVLKLKPHLAPIKLAVIPLARNDAALMKKARQLKEQVQSLGLGNIAFEDSGNIGKNYRRHDEIGTPLCITIDFATLGREPSIPSDTVTLRQRDSMQQVRIAISDLPTYLKDYFTPPV